MFRKLLYFMLIFVLPVTLALVLTSFALAHGTVSNPISRSFICWLENPESPDTLPCQDAVNLAGTQALYDWNEVNLGTAGDNSRILIPDGHLCSAGRAKYYGYDQARADWPVTVLPAGGSPYTFQLAITASHPVATFSFYVTKDGYDPNVALKWSDLEDQPFLVVENAANGYNFPATLPNKTGRHLIYMTWVRHDSLENFYACSDVWFGSAPMPTPTQAPACTAPTWVSGSNYYPGNSVVSYNNKQWLAKWTNAEEPSTVGGSVAWKIQSYCVSGGPTASAPTVTSTATTVLVLPTATATRTATAGATVTATRTATAGATVTATRTATAGPTLTRTSTPAVTNTSTRTNTPGLTATKTVTQPVTSTPTASATSLPSTGLKVQYKAADTNASDNQARPHFVIVNAGSSSVALSNLKLRYYFSETTSQAFSAYCDYAVLGCANLTVSIVSAAERYLEVGFTAAAGSLVAGGNTGEIQSRFNKNDWSNLNEADDYSFDATKLAFADWNKVALYNNGVLVWGTAPGGTLPPTATVTPVGPTATSTPVVVSGCGSLPLCDGFESQTLGAVPSGNWQMLYPSCQGTGIAIVDSAQVHSGSKSIRIDGKGGFCNHVFFGNTSNVSSIGPLVYGRVFVRASTALQGGHVTFMAMKDLNDGSKDLRLGGQNQVMAWNRESDDATVPVMSPAGAAMSTGLPVNQWSCLEFKVDGANGYLQAWLNGTDITGLTVDGVSTADIDSTWKANTNWHPSLSDIKLGWESYAGGDNTLWFDDVAFGSSRIGCGA